MTRCFPSEPEFGEERRAERAVWDALRETLPDDAALFHSVGLLDGGREQELDLLVAWPGVGLACIEVKGGLVTRDAAGWWQSDRTKKRRISPVQQSQDGKHVLLRYLKQYAPEAASARAAHLVAFPSTTVPRDWASPPDCPRAIVIDQSDLKDVASLLRRAVEQHGAGHQRLSTAGLEHLVDLLAGQLVGQTSLLSAAEEHEQRVDQMTLDQRAMLNVFRHHRRLRVIGGAGTGKSWLALEQARRLGGAGERVALVCYSRGLARWFERECATWKRREQPAYVGLFHHLPVRWGAEPGADDDSDYWERRLPLQLGELAAEQAASELFDSVIVDEGQDFGELWWPALTACLRDPAQGGLFVFMDEAQRVFARHATVPIDVPPFALGENIRNTKTIANLFSSLSGEQLRPRGLAGPKVRLYDVATDQVMHVVDDVVESLWAEGWAPGLVACLCTLHRHPVQKDAVELGGWAPYWDDFFAATDVFYGHVLGFKGLERPVVVLAVNGFRDEARAKELLYVGLSRARTLLVIVGSREVLVDVGGAGVANRLKSADVFEARG